jgi:hypothetical protein
MTTGRLHLTMAALSWFGVFALISAVIADAFHRLTGRIALPHDARPATPPTGERSGEH